MFAFRMANELENLFLSLSDKTRLKLLGLMAGGEVSVGFLADSLGESQPKISRHLAYLRNAGLVSTRRDGKWIYYGIERPTDATAANVLDAALGNTTGPAGVNVETSVRERVAEEQPYEYEPQALDEWRPDELEIHLL